MSLEPLSAFASTSAVRCDGSEDSSAEGASAAARDAAEGRERRGGQTGGARRRRAAGRRAGRRCLDKGQEAANAGREGMYMFSLRFLMSFCALHVTSSRVDSIH